MFTAPQRAKKKRTFWLIAVVSESAASACPNEWAKCHQDLEDEATFQRIKLNV